MGDLDSLLADLQGSASSPSSARAGGSPATAATTGSGSASTGGGGGGGAGGLAPQQSNQIDDLLASLTGDSTSAAGPAAAAARTAPTPAAPAAAPAAAAEPPKRVVAVGGQRMQQPQPAAGGGAAGGGTASADAMLAELGITSDGPAAPAAGGAPAAQPGPIRLVQAKAPAAAAPPAAAAQPGPIRLVQAPAAKAPAPAAAPAAAAASAAVTAGSTPGLVDVSSLGKVSVSVPAGTPQPVAPPVSTPGYSDRNEELTGALASVNSIVKGLASGELASLSEVLAEREEALLPDYLDPSKPAMSDAEFEGMADLMGDLDPSLGAKPQASAAPAVTATTTTGSTTTAPDDDGFGALDAMLDGTDKSPEIRAAHAETDDLLSTLAGQDLTDY